MILKTDEFRDTCTIIKTALDTKVSSLYNETLELVSNGDILSMNVTNKEYYVTVHFKLEIPETFTAAVNAKLFLDLVSKITSDKIEITIAGNAVKVKGNGEYKIPIVYNDNVMLTLPKIEITNTVVTTVVTTKDLLSVLQYNSKELQRGNAVKTVQSYYYLDENGAITFTSGACVNNFNLHHDVKMLLSEKVVKLFKLFKDDENVTLSIGKDTLSGGLTQNKVKFDNGDVILTAITADDSMISLVPVQAIRGMTTKQYPFTICINRNNLLQTLTRLMLFNNDKNYGHFELKNNMIVVHDFSNENVENVEILKLESDQNVAAYSMIINMNSMVSILSGCDDENVTICFGDSKAVVFKKSSVYDISPELKIK